ncbi:hypothetical protein J6590_046994 [Homalodisca vitripennis]|nr:hypothetical protein J6590_046994 [Homalodisca vitripennis]
MVYRKNKVMDHFVFNISSNTSIARYEKRCRVAMKQSLGTSRQKPLGQISQLTHHIYMVATENKQLWTRLSKLSEDHSLGSHLTKISDTSSKHFLRESSKPNLSIHIVDSCEKEVDNVSDNEVDSDSDIASVGIHLPSDDEDLLDFSSGSEDNYCPQFEFDSDDSRSNNRPERQIPRSESEGDVGLPLRNFSPQLVHQTCLYDTPPPHHKMSP